MDSKSIEQLLEKYWNGETTVEEEQHLRDYFSKPGVSDDFQGSADLFRFLETERKKTLEKDFESHVTKQLKDRREGKVIRISPMQIARIAAGIVVVVAATWFIRQEMRKSVPAELQDTYTDPQMAFEETKKALMIISGSFGKARRETERIKMFNDAEKKIQSKDTVKVNI